MNWDDPQNALILFQELLEGSDSTVQITDGVAHLTIKLNDRLDRSFYMNLITSESLKEYFPDAYKRELKRLKSEHQDELREKSSRIGGLLQETEGLQRTLDLVNDGVLIAADMVHRKRNRKKWYQFWN